MTPIAWIIVAIIVVAVVAGTFMWSRRARSAHLRDQFGPEYDRAVEAKGDRAKAEADLADREKRVKKLAIRPLRCEIWFAESNKRSSKLFSLGISER